MSILKAQHLAKRYGKKSVVEDVSLQVESGEIVGLLGPNGAGKTTCFYMIIGLVGQDGGRIYIDGEDITGLPMHGRARRGLGYLPQEASIFRQLSVSDNILAILETRSDLDRTARRQELTRLLQEFHITHIADSQGVSLSGGERRRVEIARALAANPQFILLDEPFGRLDSLTRMEMQDTLMDLLREQKMTAMMVTHDVDEAIKLSDRILVIRSNPGMILKEFHICKTDNSSNTKHNILDLLNK